MAVTLSLHAVFFLRASVYIKLALIVCVSVWRDRRGEGEDKRNGFRLPSLRHVWLPGCLSCLPGILLLFFSPLCPICLSSLYPPSLFPGSCLYILSMFRLLLHFLFLSIHVCFFLVSNPSLLLLHFPSHITSFPLVIKCPTSPVLSL